MTAATNRRRVKKKLRRFEQSLGGIVSIFMNPAVRADAVVQMLRKSGHK
jgi:hypothetical protein